MDKMDDDNDRSESQVDEMCSFCNKSLSVSPVYAYEKSYICGRCSLNKHVPDKYDAYSRQYIYEYLGLRKRFSCPYKPQGCKMKLRWGEVDRHEACCVYRHLRCPFYNKDTFPMISQSCDWTGPGPEVIQHIEQWHHDYISDPPIYSVSECDMIFFTDVDNYLFAVTIIFSNTSTYEVSVFTLGTPKEVSLYRYQLEIFSDTRDDSVILRKNSIFPLHDFEYHLKNRSDMYSIDLTNFDNLLKCPKNFTGKVGIVKKNKKEVAMLLDGDTDMIMLGTVKKERAIPVNENLLKELECPFCNDYMVPPIFICVAGHSICSSCIPRLRKCPSCQGNLANARNFTLENLTTRVNYPCRNRHVGCFYVSTSEKIRIHEGSCKYSGKQCILKCNWKGSNENMKTHIIEKHKDNILQVNQEQILDLGLSVNQRFAVIFHEDDIFRLGLKNCTNQRMLKFTVQQLGMPECPQYKYEVEIVDSQNVGIDYKISYVCKDLTKHGKDVFNDSVLILTDCLKPFTVQNQIRYKISIKDLKTPINID